MTEKVVRGGVSNNQDNLPRSFSDKDMSQKRTRKKETLRKISKGKLLPPH